MALPGIDERLDPAEHYVPDPPVELATRPRLPTWAKLILGLWIASKILGAAS